MLDKECLVLKAVKNTDLGDYALLCTGYSSGSVTTGVRHALWFPSKDVSEGDPVVVSTRKGAPREAPRDDSSVFHLAYWGLEDPIWDQDDRAGVLLYAPKWESNVPGAD